MAKKEKEDRYEVTLDEALKLAQGHHHAGNFMLAERTYRDILRTVPDHYPTVHYLGILLFQNGNLDEAEIYLQKAVNEEPQDKNGWNNYAAALTQQKKFESALEAYKKALKIDSDYLDALNNVSYVHWSLGRFDEAEKMARKVLDVDPENASGLTNLAMALSSLEKYEEALEICQKASEVAPDDSNIWTNWGNTLRDMGRVAASEAPCRKAVELNPKNPEALNNLANTLRDLGDVDKAIEYYREATDIMPDFYVAHNNLAIALLDKERCKEAAVAARYAIAFNREFPEAYGNLSKALLGLGEYDQAHMAAQKAVYFQPDSPEAYIDLAEVLLRADRVDDGEAALQEAMKRNPDSARCFMKISEVKDITNDAEGSLEALERALELSPDMPMLIIKKAQILSGINRVPEALELIDEVLAYKPGYIGAKQLKAEILISVNENEQARVLVREILEAAEHVVGPYGTLTSLKKFESEDDPDFVAMKTVWKEVEESGSMEEKVTINFAMSDAYEHMKKYDEAFEHLKIANDTKRKIIPYDSSKQPKTFVGPKSFYTPEFFEQEKGRGYKTDLPVFIIGMPRSGTTLTEQIISSHPEVYGAGELTIITNIKKENRKIEDVDFTEIGRDYIEQASAMDKSGKARRITDKMPANFLNVGLIAAALPDAKIIHCRRSPMDTCLSCYKQNFARGQYWSYNLEDMAAEYKRYLDLMEYWREVLPGRFMEIDYEETVNDLEGQARKLIDYIGLDWDDACLKPHKQKRLVMTASKAQVTKPVYNTSVEKWRKYEKGLKPLADALGIK